MSDALRELLASFVVEVDKAGELAKGNAAVDALKERLAELQAQFNKVRAPAEGAGKAISDVFARAGAQARKNIEAITALTAFGSGRSSGGGFGDAFAAAAARAEAALPQYGPTRETLQDHQRSEFVADANAHLLPQYGPTRETFNQGRAAAEAYANSLRGRLSAAVESLKAKLNPSGVPTEGGPGLLDRLLTLRNGMLALGLGGAARVVMRTVDTIGGIGEQAAKLGVTTDEIQRLGVLAESNATSVETLGTAFRALASAAVDPSKDAASAFTQLGVQVKNQDGSFRSTQDLFFDVVAALADMTDETKRSALAQKLLGRGSVDLKALMAGGREGIEAQRKELAQLPVVSKDIIDAADRMSDRWVGMKLKVQAFISRALDPLLPLVGGITDKFDSLVSQLDGSNTAIAALTSAAIALAPALMRITAAAAPWAALYLVIDDLVTTLQGGESYTRDFIEALFGEGATDKALESIKKVKDALVDLFDFVTKGRGGKLFGKLMGIDSDEVEARRLERQAAFESGAPVEAPNKILKWIADKTGLTEEVMRKRLESGIDPNTGRELLAPRYPSYGPPTAEGSVAGNSVVIGDTVLTFNGVRAGDGKAIAAELDEVLERNRDSLAAQWP